MTAADLNAALAELGLTRTEFAVIIKRDLRTVHRWCSGTPEPRTGKPTPIPDWVALYLNKLDQEQTR